MTYEPLPFPEGYTDRLTASAPRSFGRAVRDAAYREGLTIADFIRLAVGERAAKAGIQCPRLPVTSNSEFLSRVG